MMINSEPGVDLTDPSILEAVFHDVRRGIYNLNWDDDTGRPEITLTAKGRAMLAEIEQLLREPS